MIIYNGQQSSQDDNNDNEEKSESPEDTKPAPDSSTTPECNGDNDIGDRIK